MNEKIAINKLNLCSHGNIVGSCRFCIEECSTPDVLLEKEILSQRAPEGWVTKSRMAKDLKKSFGFVDRAIDDYRETNPELFIKYLDGANQLREHYSPELIKLVGNEVKKLENALPGWLTAAALAKKTGRSYMMVKDVFDEELKNRPDFFKEYLDQTGRLRMHVAPEVAEEISKQLSEHQSAPEGWMTLNKIKGEFGKDWLTVKKISDSYRNFHPEWFAVYLEKGGRKAEHLAPELVKAIANELGESELPPDGWLTMGELTKRFKKSYDLLKRLIDKYKETNPLSAKVYLSPSGNSWEYYSPDLVDAIREELDEYESAPAGWMTNQGLANQINSTKYIVRKAANKYRAAHSEWFKVYSNISGFLSEHYSPELIERVVEDVQKFESAPDGWMTKTGLIKKFKRSPGVIDDQIGVYKKLNPEWCKEYLGKSGNLSEHYSPDLVGELMRIFKMGEPAPEGWMTKSGLSKKIKKSSITIEKTAKEFRASNPEWFSVYLDKKNKGVEHYSPDLVKLIIKKAQQYEEAPEGWMSVAKIAKTIGKSYQLVKKTADDYRISNPEWFSVYLERMGKATEHFSPSLVKLITDKLQEHESAPDGWVTNSSIARIYGCAFDKVRKIADKYRDSNPEWFNIYMSVTGRIYEYYSPELAEITKREIEENQNMKFGIDREKELKVALENYLEDLEKNDFEAMEKIKKMINLMGGSNIVDILYHYRPEFRGLPVDYVRSRLGEYLGDFLIIKGDFRIKDLAREVGCLSESVFKYSLTEVMKRDCLNFYNKKKKGNQEIDIKEILKEYIEGIKLESANIGSQELTEVIMNVEKYFESLLMLKKPDNIVPALKEGRVFPDVNQLINIRELKENKKVLIGDEMGLGKSASAILAKEYLGLKCCLVVVPKNVQETWERYLSDQVDQDTGKQIGYFKKNAAPKVLSINKTEDIVKAKNELYDYVIISLEKLNDNYSGTLQELGNDMLIVDEVHKMKNLGGVRANNLLKLASKIEGDEKYISVLSGTPVPNKVGDVAMIIRLLYPEKFGFTEEENSEEREKEINKDLAANIINGDLIDLRNLLVPRMQMKKLAESIDMPDLHEKLTVLEMSSKERDIYEVLMEEDELTASQKLQYLRQFLLNPEMLDATPNIQSTKIEKLKYDLKKKFESKRKIIVFVNSYIENIIRGPKGIVNDLKNELEGVDVYVIHGQDGDESDLSKEAYRDKVQEEFNKGSRKTLLLVSGNAADVGVDYSGGEEVIFYNEPWTMYDKKQQLGRVFREGLKDDITSTTYVVEESIEEGIYKYIRAKEVAIEKLLKGIPISELEKEILKKSENDFDPNKEVNREFAEYYFSSWDKLMKMFGYIKEIGEGDFLKFLEKHGYEYAECYTDLGARSYQANASRINAALIEHMIKERAEKVKDLKIFDIASGPEMLKNHSGEELREMIFSLDINRHHFNRAGENRVLGSFSKLPVREKSIDYVNMSLALHYSRLNLRDGDYERIEVIKEMNRVLKIGGRGVLNLVYSVDLKNEEQFRSNLNRMGFSVIEEYSGEITNGENYNSRVFVLEKNKDSDDVDELVSDLGKEKLSGYAFEKNKKGKRLKDSRKIITSFKLNDKVFDINFNQVDLEILKEEKEIEEEGQSLIGEAKIEDIKEEDLVKRNFVRFYNGSRYILFKKLRSGNGAVVIR